MFAAGYSNIEDMYIDNVDIGEIAAAGLANLKTVDPALMVVRAGDHLDVTENGHPAGEVDTPPTRDPDAWAAATASAINLAQGASALVAGEGSEDLYKTMFDGMLGKLDRFSRYSTADAAREHRAAREGFGGIGVRIAIEAQGVRVSSVMANSPGGRAGLKTDDLITEIDGQSVAGAELQSVIQRLRGPVGSKIELAVLHPGGVAEKLTVARAHIVPESVSFELHGRVAYIRIYSFNQDTTRTLSQAVSMARTKIGPHIAGLILDLRDNPGGLLDQAVGVSDLFMNSGRIVSTRGRHPDSYQRFDASQGDVADGLPLVVLINGNSASASEIVAAALQDSGRAVVAGTTSYGKGTVQTVIRMPNEGELVLTWARFLAPSGYAIHHLGVLPSVCTANLRDPDQIVAAIRSGKIKPVPVAQRNAAAPGDEAILDRLRGSCPARKTDEQIDVDVATRLIESSAAYRQALALAAPANLASTAAVAVPASSATGHEPTTARP